MASAGGHADVDLHVAATRHVETARPRIVAGKDVAGGRHDFRPNACDPRANAAPERSIASGQAIRAPLTCGIGDRDVQLTHELSMAVRRDDHDRCARHGRGTRRKVDDAGVDGEPRKKGNHPFPQCNPAAWRLRRHGRRPRGRYRFPGRRSKADHPTGLFSSPILTWHSCSRCRRTSTSSFCQARL